MNRRARGAATMLLATASVVALAGCSVLAPRPTPTPWLTPACSTPDASGNGAVPGLPEGIAAYGLWSPTWDSPPSRENLIRPAPLPIGYDPWRKIWLTPIFLASGVSGTVAIVKPRDALLFVSTWDRWGNLSAPELQLGATKGVHLVGCDGVASYPALTIVNGPECVVYSVQQDGDDRLAQISVGFFGATC